MFKHPVKIVFSLLLVFFLMKNKGLAQKYNDYLFTEYGLPNGFPGVTCGNLYKDDYGFLWISNAYGVTFYNGKEFTVISQYNSDKNFYFGDFPHNFIQLDRNSLLITCSTGLYVFNYQTRKIIKVHVKLPPADQHYIRIIGFNKSRDEVVLKIDHRVYILNSALRIKKIITCFNECVTSSVRNEYTLPFVYYYTNQQHLVGINVETNATDSLAVSLNPNGIIVNGQNKNTITIGNSEKIIELNLSEKKILKTVKLPALQSKATFFANSLKLDKDNKYWLVGESGAYLYNPVSGEIKVLDGKINHFTNRQLNTNATADIWTDSSSIFIGTFDAGLYEYDNELTRFKDFYISDPRENTTMYSILVNGETLLGANPVRGLFEFPIKGNDSAYTFHTISKRLDPILQLEYLNKDYLWALYQEDFKLELINRKNLAFKEISLSTDPITKKYFSDLNGRTSIQHSRPNLRYCDENCTYLTIGKKLFKINFDKKKFLCSFIDSITTADNISCITNTPSRKFVVSSSKGALYIISNGKLVQKTQNINNTYISIKSIDTDTTGKIYMVTSNGLFIYNSDFTPDKTVTHSTSGLLSDRLFSGRIDKKQILWMSASNGLIAYDTRHDNLANFSSANLMRNSQFFSKSCSADENGIIYFGGTDGITAVRSDENLDELIKGKIYFDEIRIGNKLIHNSLIPENIKEDSPLEFNNNSLSFSFRSISYKQTATIYYKYKLEGYDTTWHLIAHDKTISFLSLAPGSYKLIVKEFFPHKESGAAISYSFRIKKPFWTTSLFIILATIAISGLMVLAVIIIMRKKLEKHRIKASLDIALKSERERISQDLHDELGAGLTSIRLLAKTVLVKENNKNIQSENILQNMSKISSEMIDQMSEIVWVLNNSNGTFANLLAHVRFYISDFIMRTQVPLKLSIENNISDDFQLTNTQRRNILLVVKEAFNNIVKHSGATTIHIEASEKNNGITLIIIDNGTGLLEKISHKGNGLNNMQKRITALGGKITFESNRGVKLIIQIPKKRNLFS